MEEQGWDAMARELDSSFVLEMAASLRLSQYTSTSFAHSLVVLGSVTSLPGVVRLNCHGTEKEEEKKELRDAKNQRMHPIAVQWIFFALVHGCRPTEMRTILAFSLKKLRTTLWILYTNTVKNNNGSIGGTVYIMVESCYTINYSNNLII